MKQETTENVDALSVSPALTTRTFLSLWPFVLGFAFCRSGIIVASYGSYLQTDEGIFTDGGVLITLAFLGFFWLVTLFKNKGVRRKQMNTLIFVIIAAEVLSLFGLTATNIADINNDIIRFILCTIATLSGSLAIYYWLRRMRSTTASCAAFFCFSALFISEIIIYLCGIIPLAAGYTLSGLLVASQFPLVIISRSKSKLFMATASSQTPDYFGFVKTSISDKRFLVTTALGIGLLSLLIGLLRGYPNGTAIAFTFSTRSAYVLLTLIISAIIIVLVYKGRRLVLSIGIWHIMQTLAACALLAYAAFPGNLEIGAIFTTTLNAMMVAFSSYIVIAFMSHGWRNPYYYAVAGWFMWLGCRALSRMALHEIYPFSNDLFIGAIMGILLLISTQVVFTEFLTQARQETEAEKEKTKKHNSVIKRIMGLDEQESLSGLRHASTQRSSEEMGRRFLLSDREIEVLSLYALGFTQKRVAEELYIGQGTVHAHIKRIYAKTGLHSRQAILDYMERHTT